MELEHLARRARALVAVLTAAALLAGCTAWKPLESPYQKALAERHGREVRVTRNDGGRVTLYSPLVSGDSLSGYGRKDPFADPHVLALADITAIETPHTRVLPAVLVAGGLLVGLLVIAAVTYEGPDISFSGW